VRRTRLNAPNTVGLNWDADLTEWTDYAETAYSQEIMSIV